MNLRKTPHYQPLEADPFVLKQQRQLLHMHAAIEASRGELARMRANLQRVEAVSHQDPLTNLLNPRGMEHEWSRFASSYQRGLHLGVVIIFIDLNGFKLVNDYAGHHIGDGLLSSFAQHLRDALRPTDIIARVGGDEFVLILPSMTADKAGALVDRIRARSADLYMDHPDCARVAEASGAGRVLDFSWGMEEVSYPRTLPVLESLLTTAESRITKFNRRRSLFATQTNSSEDTAPTFSQ